MNKFICPIIQRQCERSCTSTASCHLHDDEISVSDNLSQNFEDYHDSDDWDDWTPGDN